MRYQPQGLLRINAQNSLTKGLIFLAPMIGGRNLVEMVGGAQGTAPSLIETAVNSKGQFASFTGAGYLEYPSINTLLGPNDPASVGWIQQPMGATGLHSVAQFCTSGGAAPFLIYQSVNDSRFYFAAGLRGAGGAQRFGADTGPITNERLDAFVLTSGAGFGTINGLSLFRGDEKFSPSATTSFTGSSSTGTSIGSRAGGGDRWRGLLGCVAIWNRVLTDEEARSFNANPWQLFAAPEEEYEVAATDGDAPVIIDGSWAESSDAVAAGASVSAAAAVAWIEAGDAVSTAASVAVSGTSAWGEQGDTVALAASVVDNNVQATAAWVESSDTIAAGAQASATLAATWSEGSDTHTAAAVVGTSITATIGLTEAGDTHAALATVKVSAAVGWAEQSDFAGFAVQVLAVGGIGWAEESDTHAASVSAQTNPAASIGWTESHDLVQVAIESASLVYARAPSGPGYSPQRRESHARPAQAVSSRPASTQRNNR